MSNRDLVPGAVIHERRMDFAQLAGLDVRGADLTGCHFFRADLRSANFRGAILKNVNFNRADVSSADFTDANLENASFFGAMGVRSVFERANLTNAEFGLGYYDKDEIKAARRQGVELFRPRADLAGASFVGANLTAAKFLATNLTGADFTDASTDSTLFEGQDGLELITNDVKGLSGTGSHPTSTDRSGSESPPSASGASLADKLAELDKLLADGLINSEEHSAARRSALGL